MEYIILYMLVQFTGACTLALTFLWSLTELISERLREKRISRAPTYSVLSSLTEEEGGVVGDPPDWEASGRPLLRTWTQETKETNG